MHSIRGDRGASPEVRIRLGWTSPKLLTYARKWGRGYVCYYGPVATVVSGRAICHVDCATPDADVREDVRLATLGDGD